MDPQATSGFQNRENPQQMYEAEIRSLRAEIAVLEEQQESQEREVALHFGEHLQKALASLKGKSSDKRTGENETLANLKAGLENLEEDLARQAKINGIELTQCTVKTLEKSENKMTQQYRISGHCHFLAFQIEFELTEVEEEGIVSKSVTDLNIVVDGSEFTNISTFVSRAEDTKSLLLFLRTLKSFSDWCEHRRRTFLYFKEKYPEAVSLPEGCRAEQMAIKNPALPGCMLYIVWSIEVTEEGVVTPRINLLTKMPEQALALDEKKVAENAPHRFHNLLRLLGIEATIESVIKSMCME